MPLPPLRPLADCALDVVGLGQNSIDHVCRVVSCPTPGAKVEALDYQLLPGGQVATAMLAARRLGLRVCYVGAVGDDDLGRRSCAALQADDVRLELTVVPGAATQFSLVIVDQAGERTIVERYDPRIALRPERLPQELFASARALHLDATDLPAAIAAARWARAAGAIITLDIDRLLPGATELLGLVDLLVGAETLIAALGADPPQALRALRGLCPGMVCLTLGERGCVYLEGDELRRVPAFAIDAVDTTGCGDVFRGALLAGVLEGWPITRALRYAAAAGALQACTLGAQAGVPRRAEVEAFLAQDPQVRA